MFAVFSEKYAPLTKPLSFTGQTKTQAGLEAISYKNKKYQRLQPTSGESVRTAPAISVLLSRLFFPRACSNMGLDVCLIYTGAVSLL